MYRRASLPTLVLALTGLPLAAGAATMNFTTTLTQLNDSGISGTADFSVDTTANTLTATVDVSGLTPNTLHPQHIHGRFAQEGCTDFAPDGSPIAGACLDGTVTRDSIVPSVSENDLDGDGFLETVEGAPAYGPIILSLGDADAGVDGLPGSFPMSDADGNLTFSETYDIGGSPTDLLFDGLNGIAHEVEDLFPLTDRVYVIHGVTVTNDDPAVANDMFEIMGPTGPDGDGAPEYVTLLPGAAGAITPAPIPLPAAGWVLLSGLASLVGLRRFQRRAA